jgi:capsular polysaccharide biosynthesis protein/chaperonin cofactor prefoldin
MREIVRIIASRFIGMVIILAIVVGGVSVASYIAPKWYRSEVSLMATPSRIQSPLEETSTSMREQVSLFVTTQREIIRSDFVLAAALMMLETPQWAPEESIKAANGNGYKLPADLVGQVDDYITANSDKLRKLQRRVSIVTPGGPDASFTQTFKIRVDWPEQVESDQTRQQSQQQAARNCYLVADYIVRAYKARYKQLEEERASAAQTFMKDQALAAAEQRLNEASAAVAGEAERLGEDLVTVASIIGQMGIDSGIATITTQLESQLNETEARIAELNALKSALDKQLAKPADAPLAVPDEFAKSNNAVMLLMEKIATLKLDVNNLASQYTDDYRELQYKRDELGKARGDLRDEMVKQNERIATTLAKLNAQREEYNRRLTMFRTRMKKLGPQAIRYERLQEQLSSAMKNYTDEEKQWLDAVRAESLAEKPIMLTVLDNPSRPNPDDPRRPIIWLNVLIAVVGGVVLALIYAFLADHFDHTIKSVDDAERYLGTPVIASVPKLGRRIIRVR